MIRPDTRTAIVTLAERLRNFGVSSEDWADLIHDELENTPLATTPQHVEEVLQDSKDVHQRYLSEHKLRTRILRELSH